MNHKDEYDSGAIYVAIRGLELWGPELARE